MRNTDGRNVRSRGGKLRSFVRAITATLTRLRALRWARRGSFASVARLYTYANEKAGLLARPMQQQER